MLGNHTFVLLNNGFSLRRSITGFVIRGKLVEWSSSYLSGRSQRLMFDGFKSDSFDLRFNVPQGSCLVPLVFVVYASKFFEMIQAHLPDAHCFADDNQIHLNCLVSPTVRRIKQSRCAPRNDAECLKKMDITGQTKNK